jgi:hypothetical protein
MLRDRLLGVRWLLYLVVAWGILSAGVPSLGEALPLPPAGAGADGADLEAIRLALEQRIVGERLAALGIAPEDAAAVVARLSPEERAELAARAQELEVGGGAAVAAAVAIVIVIAMAVVLFLELIGRRVVSRPS